MSQQRQAIDKAKRAADHVRRTNPVAPEIRSYIAELKDRYGQYAIPVEEGREIIDRAMGKRTLTEVLCEMRGETV